ncbi:MAG: hypothetical protein HOJ15_01915 [Candidatus Jacksonbacteria bacterium]|jgi:hypothetical protein|nr:hypothetical protein [Candidatus Jacksonbacteria bacterium]MBT6034690.1 hypothetical protein [Candidatus Jacksonbacteria bacterium]MBT6301163.1 hypothetical protein [Candidatus Jacksonbacteria bacterium]MBT6757263.1 hypothetical protein [Candidatus Jacksonbacteria bacterium]MBT6954771.1 hypothetical protein [Candidatus Jacksonbacteria bacterium]
MTLSEDVLKEIKKDHITPKPRWQFLVKDCCVWVLGVVSVFVGSLAFAVMLSMLINNDWDLYSLLNGGAIGLIIATLPYFWIILILLFALLIQHNLKHTKKGYKYSPVLLIAGGILISGIVGTFLYNIGAGVAIDDVLLQNVPVYSQIGNRRASIWNPEKGRLSGVIVSVDQEGLFLLEDFSRQEWQVLGEYTIPDSFPLIIQRGNKVRMLGDRLNEFTFEAYHVMPWMIDTRFQKAGMHMQIIR